MPLLALRMSDDGDQGDYGPAMRGLNDFRRQFVWAMVMTPGIAPWKAAQRAGYSGDKRTMQIRACELLHNDAVTAAIRELAGKRLTAAALGAAEYLVSAWANPKMPHFLRMKAANSLLDRVGLGAEQNINVKHEHTDRTGAALMERIRELAKKHGMDPDKLLAGGSVAGQAPKEPLVIEAQAVESKEASS